jgi:predicted acetyltransferase
MNPKHPYEIQELTGDAMAEAIYTLDSYAFHASPPFPDKAEPLEIIRQLQGVRYFAVLEKGQVAAGVAATQMTQNVRGKIFPAHGIWGVVTQPQARRKGYSRQAMAQMLSAQRECGQVFSCLYPFRESFYNRMGYINFPQPRFVRFNPQNLAPLLKMDLPGEIETVSISEGYAAYRAFQRQVQTHTHGMAVFEYDRKEIPIKNHFWMAKAMIDDQLEGLMLYDLRGDEVTHFQLRARRFSYLTATARYLLLSWIARHIDQADQAELLLPADDYPETWLEDLKPEIKPIFAVPMGRVLDLARLQGLPVGPGRFAAEVKDPLCPWNEQIWEFESVHGELHVNRAKQADCRLSIQAVSALVYGVNDPADFIVRGWGNPSERTQSSLRKMFSGLNPYLYEMF